jgi:transposase, IS30 family
VPPRRQERQRQPRFVVPMLMISDRPAGAADRSVPGHWEGDLIIGKDSAAQIGTLVERASRYLRLVRLPADRDAETVRDALAATMATLPQQLKRSLIWDQSREMPLALQFAATPAMPVYFCDPHSPWQRGSNENTYWPAPPVLPQGHRPVRPHRCPPRRRRRRRRAQRQATQNARLGNPSRAPR